MLEGKNNLTVQKKILAFSNTILILLNYQQSVLIKRLFQKCFTMSCYSECLVIQRRTIKFKKLSGNNKMFEVHSEEKFYYPAITARSGGSNFEH